MSKEKVYIVLSHKHSLKKKSTTEWEVAESVEFVSTLRNKHLTTSSAIGDYLNETMLSGSRVGMEDYTKFENYVRNKYAKEMAKLDDMYLSDKNVIKVNNDTIVDNAYVDQFGNTREKTVFDIA